MSQFKSRNQNYQKHAVHDVGGGGILTLQEFGLNTLPDDVASSGIKKD